MLTLRPAQIADAPLIRDLIFELADYERAPECAQATVADLERDGWGPEPKFRVVIAEWHDQPAGFALWFFNYSTWQGRPGLYLEDLFVRPPFRGLGIGKALLVHLAQTALANNCGRFQWQVLDWNTPAIDFYKSLGAEQMDTWLNMRVEGDALTRLAQTTQNTAKASSGE